MSHPVTLALNELICAPRTVYSHTKDNNYLVTARRVADYFLTNLPTDGIVPWYVIIATPANLFP